ARNLFLNFYRTRMRFHVEIGLRDIGYVEYRFTGQHAEAFQTIDLIGIELQYPQRNARRELVAIQLESLLLPCMLAWIGLPRSDSFVDRFFQNLEVSQQQFGFYNLNVSYRVYITEYMGDIPFLQAPDDVSDSVYGSDVAQELIAQSFTLAGSLAQARNVDELDKGGRNVLRVEYFFE